ncbi:TetR/AcrR family transcriptional regulator [Rhodococcus maanshanensis]|uniref:DNA-binding transcriptional regulator, AcrR family n=1 Tax=Rhodococcus maanshanensis TaxID=183556 RepID=A0A1H7VAQ4_9NOCA|nr:TetR/AcrR family transcriptional regulator [Rhodococcus maanshanensis]SEM05837.1 DNA-binding transcriptional regulator, AcrR family [Rhodococcus maanshanensis]
MTCPWAPEVDIGTQHRGTETRQRLLDGALAVFAQSGPTGFTMTAVTGESGVSVGSLYHHFGSFDGLSAALYSRCMSDLLDSLIAELVRCRTARTGIKAMAAAYLRWVGRHRAQAHFIHASAYSGFLPAYAEQLAAEKGPRMQAMADWMTPHVEAGRVVALSPALIEMLVIGPVAETSRRWLSAAPGIDLDEAARVLPERIWQSVRGEHG